MLYRTLYRYKRENGGITVSPIIPDVEFTQLFRLTPSEGKVLTKDGVNLFWVIDVESIEGWYEIDEPKEEEPEPELLEVT